MGFIYSLSNPGAYWLRIRLLLYRVPCVYELYGESGSGKSLFLHEQFCNRTYAMFFSCESLKELMLTTIGDTDSITTMLAPSSNIKYVIFDNVEDLNTDGEYALFSQMVIELVESGKTVFLCKCGSIPLRYKYKIRFSNIKFKRTRTNKRIIRRIARNLDKHLDRATINRLLIDYKHINGLEKRIMRM